MARRTLSTPTPVGALLASALPPLADRLLALAVRRDWADVVGSEIARRAAPGDLRAGTLTVFVDNSPWLQELTLREAELLGRLQARHGRDSVKALSLALGRPSRDAEPAVRPAAPIARTLSREEAAWVDGAVASLADPTLAETLRGVLVKDALSRRPTGDRA
jgi:hypothetical protein